MAKKKSRKRAKTAQQTSVPWGGRQAGGRTGRRLNVVITGALVVAVIAGALWWWRGTETEQTFLALSEEGKPALERVREERNLGGGHLQPGQTYRYGTAFPTSGPHHVQTTDPGFYTSAQPATMIVHSLEHGHVVLYYDQPGAEALDLMRAWTSLYDGHWDGVVAVPSGGLGTKVVLTAWAKRLDLDPFDPAAAAAFIDAYRGRGPENPVR